MFDIQQWLKQFEEYFKENPNHGDNCIEVDKFTGQFRQELIKANLSPKAASAVKVSLHYLARG